MAGVKPGAAATLGDLAAIAVGLWFLFGAAFAEVPAKRALDAVGALVIALSALRVWRRHRGRT